MTTRREFLNQTAAAGLVAAGSIQVSQAGTAALAPTRTLKTYAIARTDLVVSRMAYGIALLETDWRSDELVTKAKGAIRTAYEQGVTFFDLADTYGLGQSERALAEVLKQSPGMRERIVIQTKCGQVLPPGWAPGDPEPTDGRGGVDLSAGHIRTSVEGSLRRLNTDHLDILLLHIPDPLVRPEEVAQVFDDLHRSGKVRHFGVSNHSIEQLELLKKSLRQPLVINQIRLGLGYYRPIFHGEIVDYCRRNEIQVQAWSPLRTGFDIFKPVTLLKPPPDAPAEVKRVTQVLEEMARQKGTNASAIALAWLLHHPAGIVPIVGSSNPKHVAQNCEADRVSLNREEWYRLAYFARAVQPAHS